MRKTNLRICIILFLISLVIYSLSSGENILRQSWAPNYIYLADQFIHGKFIFDSYPCTEMFPVREGYSMTSPFFPAIVMIPFVLIWGLAANDVVITIIIGALNVALMFLVLRKYCLEKLTVNHSLWLTVFFGFGTLHYYSSCFGMQWFTAHIVYVMLTLLYFCFVKDVRHPVLAGFCFICAFFSRTPTIFGIILFAFFLWDRRMKSPVNGNRELFKSAALFLIPVFAVGAFGMYYNYARFSDPFEFGHRFVSGHESIWDVINFQYFKQGLYYHFLKLPIVRGEFPYVSFDYRGLSMFILSPALVYIFRVRRQTFYYQFPLVITAVLIASIGIMHYNGGSFQLGPRYSLDYLPYLMLSIAISQRGMGKIFKFLIVMSCIFNVYGTMIFSHEYLGRLISTFDFILRLPSYLLQ